MLDVERKIKATLSYLSEGSNPLPTPKPSAKFVFHLAGALTILDDKPNEPSPYREQAVTAARRVMGQTLFEETDVTDGYGYLGCISDAAEYLVKAFPGEGERGEEDNFAFVKEAFGAFLKETREALFKKCDDLSPSSTPLLTASLSSLVTSTKNFCQTLTSGPINLPLKSISRFPDRAYETCTAVVNRRVACRYRYLRTSVVSSLSTLCGSVTSNPLEEAQMTSNKKFGKEACEGINRLHNEAVEEFGELGRESPVDPSMLQLSVHGQARTFVLWVSTALEACAGCVGSNVVVALSPTSDDSLYNDDLNSSAVSMREAAVEEDPFDVDMGPLEGGRGKGGMGTNGTLPLAIAEAARYGEDNVPSAASEFLRELGRDMGGGGGGGGITDVDMDGACSLRFAMASTRCLTVYTCDVGNEAGELVCLGINNPTGGESWTLGKREVRDVREGVTLMLGRVKKSALELAGAFGEGARSAPANTVSKAVSVPSNFGAGQQGSRGGVAMDVERMFVSAVRVGGQVEFNRESVVEGIMVIALKGHLEACMYASEGSGCAILSTL